MKRIGLGHNRAGFQGKYKQPARAILYTRCLVGEGRWGMDGPRHENHFPIGFQDVITSTLRVYR